jgi:hypothetical protein
MKSLDEVLVRDRVAVEDEEELVEEEVEATRRRG